MSINIENLSKRYGENIVLNNLSLSFKDSERYCIMGPSGCGKTTFLHILLGLVDADSGTVSGTKNKRKSVVFQDNRLCDNLTVNANIKLVCDKTLKNEDISNSLESVGLSGYGNRSVNELSGGMRRRVAIVRAALYKSKILIMDEPFKELDSESRSIVIKYLKSQTSDRTIIWVTHNLYEAVEFESEVISFSNVTNTNSSLKTK